MVEDLASHGFAVAIHSNRSHDEADAVAEGINRSGGRAAVVAADLTDMDAVSELVGQAEAALGPISLLVNNASPYGLEAWWLTIRLPHFVIAELLALACVLALLWTLPGLRIHMVPRRLRYQAAHANAVKQFLARNVHRTTARTGVLIFVSIAERYAEVVADSGIDAKVGQQVWDGVV
ncbi:SDR family NAD(P)-dependent oxidoreductase, partial [Mesorhizobium sp. M2D.F.Ca.ET.145.01.1.1]